MMDRSLRSAFCALGLLGVGALAAPPALAGGLTFVEAEATAANDPAGALGHVVDVAVSPDGAHLYAAVERDRVTALERDAGTGELTILQSLEDGVGGVHGLGRPDAVAVTPDGACVYVTTDADDSVVAFERTPGTGLLTFVEVEQDGVFGVTNLRNPVDVVASPDSAHVYVVAESDDAVVVFVRNSSPAPACSITFVESHEDDVGGVDGLMRPRAISISGDGAHLYTSGGALTAEDDNVAVFARDGGTGALTFLEHHQDGMAGVDGIATGRANALSPDDRFLYVAGGGDAAIARFVRDADDLSLTYGRLTFAGMLEEGGDVSGLAGARGLAASPDGGYLYVVGGGHLVVLRRDPATGAIAFLALLEDDTDGVLGLSSVQDVAVSPDAAHVYAAGRNDNAVSVFEVDTCGNLLVGPDEQCDGTAGCSASCRLDLCPPAPLAGCRAVTKPLASLLLLKDDTADKRDKLTWKWRQGAATTFGELDDPVLGGDDYLLCVYDGSASPQPLATFAAPSGGLCDNHLCWQSRPTSFRYKDKLRTPDGLKKMVLGSGAAGKAKLVVNGKGSNLFFRAATPGALLSPAGLTLPVRVQMTNSESATPICWEAVYDTGVIRNDAGLFKAVGD